MCEAHEAMIPYCVPESVKTYFPQLALTEIACCLTVGGNQPVLVCLRVLNVVCLLLRQLKYIRIPYIAWQRSVYGGC